MGIRKKIYKNLQEPLASFEKVLYYIKDASVAQWIEQWPPEPCAEVRFLSGAFLYIVVRRRTYE